MHARRFRALCARDLNEYTGIASSAVVLTFKNAVCLGDRASALIAIAAMLFVDTHVYFAAFKRHSARRVRQPKCLLRWSCRNCFLTGDVLAIWRFFCRLRV